MPVTFPPDAALREFTSPTTHHTRRIEIYESDAVTRWAKDTELRLKGGQVSVDYSRDERRALDLTLSNDDGVLETAAGEFWYDKIIKVFRGVRIDEQPRVPSILVAAEPTETMAEPFAFRRMLVASGFDDVRVNTAITSASDLNGFDIIVNLNSRDPNVIALTKQAYAAGKMILTVGNGTPAYYGADLLGPIDSVSLGTQPPTIVSVDGGARTIRSTYTASNTASNISIKPTGSHPLMRGWSAFTYPEENESFSVLASEITTGTVVALANNDKAALTVFEPSGQDGRWVMFHPYASVSLFQNEEFQKLIHRALEWLNPVSTISEWEVQIGEFMVDRISEPHFPYEVRITGRDYTKKCMLSKFAYATQFVGGMSLESIIASLAAAAGIVKRSLPATGVVIDRAFFFERNVSRWDAMKEIATAYNYEIFFDATGYLTIRPYRDPATTPPVITLQTGREGQVGSYSKSTTDTRLFNHIMVIGESSDTGVPNVWAERINTNPNSPTNVSRIGDRYFEYASAFIETQQQADDLADTYQQINSLEEFELSFDTLMLPWLEVGDILGWKDPRPQTGDPTTFLLSTLTLPLELAPMSGSAKRVLVVGV